MGAVKRSLIVAIILLSFANVSGLKISYNTTHPLQFKGVESFENLEEVRVIFRALPISIRAGESANLSFRVENPTVDLHRVRITLIDVPPGFSVGKSGLEIERDVGGNSSEQIVFTLTASADIASRSYFYAFDVVDETLASDGGGVVNTTKLLGTYHGLNVIDTKKIELEESEQSVLPVIALLIIAVLSALALRWRAKR
jgi:uncharacterized membrane protein